jgi:hypothetical protein
VKGKPFSFAVEAGKVREFARATRSEHPAFVGDDGRQVSPPTFTMRAMFLAGAGENVREPGNDFARTMHAEQEFIFSGPPPQVGAALTAVQRTGPVVVKTGRRGGEMTFVEIDTDFLDEAGTVVVEARFTTVQVSQVPTEAER